MKKYVWIIGISAGIFSFPVGKQLLLLWKNNSLFVVGGMIILDNAPEGGAKNKNLVRQAGKMKQIRFSLTRKKEA